MPLCQFWRNSLAEEAEELLVGKTCLAHDALHDMFGQVKPFMVRDSNPAGEDV